MKNQIILLLSIVFFLSSCEKNDVDEPNITEPKFPITLEFSAIDYSNGINTYTMNGLIETPDHFSEQIFSFDTAKRYFNEVFIKSQDSAQFIFTVYPDCDEECLSQLNDTYKKVGISTRNDSIVFTVDFIYHEIFFTIEFPATGTLTQKLAFANYTMMSVNYQGNNFSTLSLESGLGVGDYSEQINDLGIGDTLALMKYNYTFIKK